MAETEISGPLVTVARVADAEAPCYAISVAARMVGVHAQTLRYYERVGLVEPARSRGNIRMYSALDVQQARWIRSLIDDLGMNLAGVDVVIRMSAQMENLEQEVHRLRSELAGLP